MGTYNDKQRYILCVPVSSEFGQTIRDQQCVCPYSIYDFPYLSQPFSTKTRKKNHAIISHKFIPYNGQIYIVN